MKTLIFAAMALTFAFNATATEGFAGADVGTIPVTQVKTFHSNAGEGLNDFVKRIAPEFASYTANTGYEACGEIAVTAHDNDGTMPGAFSVMMGTIGSHIGCRNEAIESGYNKFGKTIHSHPQERTIRLSALDMKVRGTPAGKLRMEHLDTCHFSPQDLTQPGYLVTCGKVLYQRGAGTETEI